MNTFDSPDSPLFENDLPEEITALIEWVILHYYNKKDEYLKYVVAKILLFLERNGHIEIKNYLHSIFYEGMEFQYLGCQRFKKSDQTKVQIDEFNCLNLSTIKDVAIEGKKLIITQYNHTKLIIPFYDEEKLNTAYTRIGIAIGSNKFK